MKKHSLIGIQLLILAVSFWIFRPESPHAAQQVKLPVTIEVEASKETSVERAPAQTITEMKVITTPTPTPAPARKRELTLAEVEKILDDDDACAFYKIQESEEALIREAVTKRLKNMSSVLFMSADELNTLENSPVPLTQLFLGLYHAGLLGGLPPPEVDYPLALLFLQRGSAKQPTNGIFYLYEAYLQFLMGNSPVLQKSLLMEAIHHPLFVSFTAFLARQAMYEAGTNATSWLATKVALSKVPVPVPPPILFYKLVLKDASRMEIDETIAWGKSHYDDPFSLSTERVTGKKIVETFWKDSSSKDQPLPQMPFPFVSDTPFTDEAGIDQFNLDMRKSPCERAPLDRYYHYCKLKDCPW